MSKVFETQAQLPIFDISKPLDPLSLSSLYETCQEFGFFRIINHGVSKKLYTKLFSTSNNLFNLPYESKLKIGPFSSLKSYTPHFIASPFFESIRVDGPDFFGSAHNSFQALFDDHPDSGFSDVLKEYGNKMTELSEKIMKTLLMSLGDNFENRFYDSEFKNCHGYLRINNYSPPDNILTQSKSQVEGLGTHTDMSCVTIVNQDEIGGLQVKLKNGEYFDINPCEETLVVNIGDLLHAWSNGKLRSSEHRVVLKPSVGRFSVAFFWCLEDDKVVFAPTEVVGEEGLRVFKPFVCGDYLRFRESNEKGKFEKVGYNVEDFAGI